MISLISTNYLVTERPETEIIDPILGKLEDGCRVLQEVSADSFESMCHKLLGYLSPDPVRRLVWSYRLLKPNSSRVVQTQSLIKELFSRAAAKGFSLANLDKSSITRLGSTRMELTPSRVADASRRKSNIQMGDRSADAVQGLIRKMVLSMFVDSRGKVKVLAESAVIADDAVPANPAEQTGKTDVSLDWVYIKRVEHLVFAAYILYGTLTQRSVAVATLLLKLFPEESPISEKILRMLQRINDECLPSEHFNRKYSNAAITQNVWNALSEVDSELFFHLQNYTHTEDTEVVNEPKTDFTQSLRLKGRMSRKSVIEFVAQERSKESARSQKMPAILSKDHINTDILLKTTNSPTYPKSFVLLRGWFEQGFFGWLPEAAVNFLWDQMLLSSSDTKGGLSTQFERILSGAALVVLRLLRTELMNTKVDMVETLRKAGNNLRTRILVEAFRSYFLHGQEFQSHPTYFMNNVAMPRGEETAQAPVDGAGASAMNGQFEAGGSPGSLPSYKGDRKSASDANGGGGEEGGGDGQENPHGVQPADDQNQSNLTTPTVVSYVTDVEGNLEYWDKYLDMSEVVIRVPNSENPNARPDLELKPNTELVFGGDVCDRGPGDIRFIMEMLSLKEKYYERVHFILGNRDTNKLRFPFECTRERLEEPPICYWMKGKDGNPYNFEADKVNKEGADLLSDRVKWMLKNTMGSPDCFLFRSEELQELYRSCSPQELKDLFRTEESLTEDTNPLTDEQVAQSFLDLVRPQKGILTEYLMHGKVAHIIGNTLFVHGAITKTNMGIVPPYDGKGMQEFYPDRSVQEWVDEINRFASYEIMDYVNNSESYIAQGPAADGGWVAQGGWDHPQPASRILTYGMGFDKEGKEIPTAVYANFLEKGAPKVMEPSVSEWLHNAGIQKLVVGHQPHGDSPLTIQCGHDVTVIGGDTSYAAFAKYIENTKQGDLTFKPPVTNAKLGIHNKPNTRGVATSEILFYFHEGTSKLSTVRIKGNLNVDVPYDFMIFDPPLPQEGGNSCNSIVGKCTSDNWWIKGIIPADTQGGEEPLLDENGNPVTLPPKGYFLCRSAGFTVDNTIVAHQFIEDVMENGIEEMPPPLPPNP